MADDGLAAFKKHAGDGLVDRIAGIQNGAEAKDDGSELGFGEEFELRGGFDDGRGGGGEGDELVDHGGEFDAAEGLEADPEFEGVEAARGEQRPSDEVGDAFGAAGFGVEIVGVDADGIEAALAGEEGGVAGGEEEGSAVGGVDVQPDVFFGGDAGDLLEIVDEAEVGGAGGGDDGDGEEVALAEGGDFGAEAIRTHAEGGVARDFDDGLEAEAELDGGFFNAEMGDFRAEEAKAGELGREAFFADGPGELGEAEVVAGEEEAHVVALGASGGESSTGGEGESGQLGQPGEDLLFEDGGGGGLVEGVHGVVEGGEEGFGGEGGQEDGGVEMGGGVGVPGLDGVLGDEAEAGEEGGGGGAGVGLRGRLEGSLRLVEPVLVVGAGAVEVLGEGVRHGRRPGRLGR